MRFSKFILALLALLLIGCSSAAPTPVSTPVPTAAPLISNALSQEVAALSVSTPIPALVSEPTSPPPSLTPQGRLGPKNFPLGINPLTGLPADPQALALPPLNIKISDSPPCVRPQYGLPQADVIFEHYVEAWVTRLTAVFHSQLPTRVGSVRSARQIDFELPAIFGSGFVFSGASAGNLQIINTSDFAARTIHALDNCPVLCRVSKESIRCQSTVHTLFANAQEAEAALVREGHDKLLFSLEGWAFSDQPLMTGEGATRIDVNYLNSPVSWKYQAETGLYFRSQAGNAHTDAGTGQRLTTSNIVMLYANHTYTDIRESPSWYSLQIQFWGTGPALLFRDGQIFQAQWVRASRQGLFTLVDSNNLVVPLHPGQTWFEFVGLASTSTHVDGYWKINPEVLPQQTPP